MEDIYGAKFEASENPQCVAAQHIFWELDKIDMHLDAIHLSRTKIMKIECTNIQ